MNPERWARIKEVFCAALERDEKERPDFIEAACGSDVELRGELELLLREHSLAPDLRSPVKPRDLAGRTIAHYRILGDLGHGGMGDVYRAEDTNLSRHVAIKVLPDVFASDPERLARFEREAKVLASLSHPNIASIYGLEQADGKRFLVLELVEGQTLAQRIAKGPLPFEEAIGVCRQIAEGLEAAHEKGIIHRDLKPANIQITPVGNVKILDFGLARAFQNQSPEVDQPHSPTITDAMTRPGMALGTAAYMSPEQARGKPVDKRTDIWAFGCILYECLTGKRPFEGETITETLAAILKDEPDWDALPASVPGKASDLLRRCMKKDPRERLRDIGDAAIEIAEAGAETVGETAVRPGRSGIKWNLVIPLLLGAALIGVVAGLLILLKTRPSFLAEMITKSAGRPAPAIARRMSIRLPQEWPLAPVGLAPAGVGRPALAISPDGLQLAYAGEHDGETQLYKRRLDSMKVEPIPGTSGAYNPFFSPDGKWIGFFVGNQLKKISTDGGQPILLCEAINCYGGTWADDGKIYFAPHEASRLCRVSVEVGVVETVAVPDKSKGIAGFWWPHAFPGGKGVLFRNGVLSLPAKKTQRLFNDRDSSSVEDPKYLSSGHIVFWTDSRLMAAPFDLGRLGPTGTPRVVLEGVRTESFGGTQCAISDEGTLVFVPGQSGSVGRPVLVNWRGEVEVLPFPQDRYGSFRISPDGTKFVVQIARTSSQIWIYDLVLKGAPRRLSTEEKEGQPIWTPRDGSRITFSAVEDGSWSIYWRPADRSSERQRLIERKGSFEIAPESWSPDGQLLSFRDLGATDWDVFIFNRKSGEANAYLAHDFNEWGSAFSPDGDWVAYTSDESGDYEVYLQQYPHGRKVQVSTGGGNEEPVWSRDGRKLFYRNGRRWLCATDPTNPKFSPGDCQLVFRGDFINISGLDYDVMPDGQRFLVLQSADTSSPGELHVILNWFEELERLVPAR